MAERPVDSHDSLPRRISVWSTAAILIGSTIGSGIFRVPSVTAAETGSVGAIALQGVRRAQVTLGETVVVTGLGLIGLITVQLLKAAVEPHDLPGAHIVGDLAYD